jgi:hypothetical protein
MVINSTNINKANNHLSSWLTEHKKIKTYDVGNPGPSRVLGQQTIYYKNLVAVWFVNKCIFNVPVFIIDNRLYNIYFSRFLYIMPTLLKTYSNNQPNPVLITAIQFVCKTFYILHRKPFILQVGIICFISTENHLYYRWV